MPFEFQIQQPHIANPPTPFLTLLSLLKQFQTAGSVSGSAVSADEFLQFLATSFPALQRHVNWFFTTQTSHRSAVNDKPLPASALPVCTARSDARRKAHAVLQAESERKAVPSSFRWGGRTIDHNLASGNRLVDNLVCGGERQT